MIMEVITVAGLELTNESQAKPIGGGDLDGPFLDVWVDLLIAANVGVDFFLRSTTVSD